MRKDIRLPIPVAFFTLKYLKKKMILIDKQLSEQRLILTLTEQNISTGSVPILKVENRQSNINYSFTLPTNSSQFKGRYDMYVFPTSAISTWEVGRYIYNVVEFFSSNNTYGKVLEIGLLEVIGSVEEQFVSLPMFETDDDYLVMPTI